MTDHLLGYIRYRTGIQSTIYIWTYCIHCNYTCTHVHIHMHGNVSDMCLYVCLYMCLYAYLYIYVCVCVIYIYIHVMYNWCSLAFQGTRSCQNQELNCLLQQELGDKHRQPCATRASARKNRLQSWMQGKESTKKD